MRGRTAVVLEAVGDDYDVYSDGFGGVSASTGLATVLGWIGHEQQWRGGDSEILALLSPRATAVRTIYSTTDVEQAVRIGGKDRLAHRESFEHRQRRAFPERGKHLDVERRDRACDVLRESAKDEAIALLNAELDKNGYAALRKGRTLVICTKEEAKKRELPVKSGNRPEDIPKNAEMVTQIIPVRFISRDHLVANKRAAGRKKDLADLEALGE